MAPSLIKKVCTKAQHQISKDYKKSQKWLADHGGLTSLGEKIVKLRREKIANTLKENGFLDKEFLSEEEIDTKLENKLDNIDSSGVKESPIIAKENSIEEAPVVKVESTDEQSKHPAVEEKKVPISDDTDREASAANRLLDARSKFSAAYSNEKKREQMWDQITASTSQPLRARQHYKTMNEKADMMWEKQTKAAVKSFLSKIPEIRS